MASISLPYMASDKLAKLLAAAYAGGDIYAQQLPTGELGVGPDPLRPTRTVDFAQERLLPVAAGAKVRDESSQVVQSSVSRQGRKSGAYSFDLFGATRECGSLKDVLLKALNAIEDCRPGMLEKLERVKKRTKRIVARDPVRLFDRPSLRQKYSERLRDGWWFGTNNSGIETKTWLEQACEVAGLKWDRDFSVSF